jgi:hypothetical protein
MILSRHSQDIPPIVNSLSKLAFICGFLLLVFQKEHLRTAYPADIMHDRLEFLHVRLAYIPPAPESSPEKKIVKARDTGILPPTLYGWTVVRRNDANK